MRHRFSLLLATTLLISSFALADSPIGQSRTLLPDGRILLTGGEDSQSTLLNTALMSSPDGQIRPLQSGLLVARAGHTATVLPDGTVLIFGGIGQDGKLVTQAEIFDPIAQKFSVLPNMLAVPRAFHTATLLTDGRVLLVGGLTASNQFADDVQLWDFRTGKALAQNARLSIPREGHHAVLLSDESVRISGGTDHFGRPVQADEIFDPLTLRFEFVSAADSGFLLPGIAESIPDDGATDAPIENPITLRFHTLINVNSVTSVNMTLSGLDQIPLSAKVTPAEGGRLAFLIPASPLQPGTSYVLRIKNLVDISGAELPEQSITFQTAGMPPDPAGLGWIPNATWTAPEGITKFQQLPPLQAPVGSTALAGQILKLNGWPLEHVTLEIDGNSTRSDSTGRFLLRGITPGHHILWIDGSTANHSNASYGVYPVGVTITASKTNILDYTVWMTRLDTAHAINIASPTTRDLIITNPDLPGVELHLPAHTVIRDRYGKVVRQITITPIPLNKPPFPLPPGVQLPVFFVIQPGGAQIEVLNHGTGPDGAQLVYPNRLNLKS
jgi:hypothetical protein